MGFQEISRFEDRITYVDVSTKEIFEGATPQQVLQLLKDGNERFASGEAVTRDHCRPVGFISPTEHPQAIILACVDSRVAAERIFDLSIGEILSLRVAGNIVSEEELGSMEYGCAVTGAKLIVVLGHLGCGAITSTIKLIASENLINQTGLIEHLSAITGPIAESVREETETIYDRNDQNDTFVNNVTILNVRRAMQDIQTGAPHCGALLMKKRSFWLVVSTTIRQAR